MVEEFIRRRMADKEFKTWGFFARTQYSWDNCYECGQDHISEIERPTKIGHWLSEWRKLRRLGFAEYRQQRKQDQEMREWMRSAITTTNRFYLEHAKKQTFFVNFYNGSATASVPISTEIIRDANLK